MCSTYLLGLPLFLGTAGTAGSTCLALFATGGGLFLGTATGGGLLFLGSGGLGHLAVAKKKGVQKLQRASGGRFARRPASQCREPAGHAVYVRLLRTP